MTVSSQVEINDGVELVEFRRLNFSNGDVAEGLAKELGVVYVTAITRDGCSGCMEQKPLFRALATKMNSELGETVHFSDIHVRYADGDRAESWESKKMLRHAAYPTYMVHVRSGKGALEVYRAIYPSMDELEKQARESLELAKFYKEEARK